MNQLIPTSMTMDILEYLDCPLKAPTLRYLNQLLLAYLRKVPWESVSRIVKRHETLKITDCPRWPEEFWNEAMQHGFGGTCYESSLAFYALLTALGYEGYLTVNDMGDTRGCHAALILIIGGEKYLVDNTIPVHSAIRLNKQRVVSRRTPFRNYILRPSQKNRYEVERSHHSGKNAFTLVDVPVSLSEYKAIVTDDYKETGHFLKSVVMTKLIDDTTWRFFSDHKPYRLESFSRSSKEEFHVNSENLPHSLAEIFQMPEDKIFAALSHINGTYTQSAPTTSPLPVERSTQ